MFSLHLAKADASFGSLFDGASGELNISMASLRLNKLPLLSYLLSTSDSTLIVS